MRVKLLFVALMATAMSLTFISTSRGQIKIGPTEIQQFEIKPGDVASWFQISDVKPSSHWMGIVVRPMDPLLKRHLQLDGGLIVQGVTKDSPAAKAGIEVDDILLAVNDDAIADYQALMDFLSKNKGDEVTLSYLRDGKKKSAKVKPTERPDGQAKFFAPPIDGEFDFRGKDPEEIRMWFEKMAKEKWGGDFTAPKALLPDGENGLKLRFFHPGVVFGEDMDVDVELDLPEGLQIVVIKQGDKAAKIQVKRGEDEWEITEKELDKLPEDIRAHVKKYLSGGKGLRIRAVAPKVLPIKPLEGRQVQGVPRVQAHAIQLGGNQAVVEKKLDQINNRLEKIEKALQKLADD